MNISNNVATQEKSVDVKIAPIMISLTIGVFFAILNETLLNVAFTDLIKELQITEAKVQWLSTSFMLIVGILVPVSALITQWFTTRQMFLGAMILFTIGTVISGFSPNFSILLVGRIIQASGTGLLIPVMMNTVLVLFPPDKRGGAMGTIGLVIMFAPAIGPTLSGLIIEALSWRWLFFVVLPFSIFSIIFAFIYLKNVTEVTKPKVDLISVMLSTLGFGGFVFGFSSMGEGVGPFSISVLAAGMLSLGLFIRRQLKMEVPILDLRAFKYPMFTITTIMLIVIMMTMFATFILLPMFLQSILALSAFAAGIALLPGGILNGFLSPVAGRLFDAIGPRILLISGSALVVIVMAFFANISASTSMITVIILYTLFMIGICFIMMPGQTNGLNELPKKLYPHGTAIINTLLQVGGAIGVALFIGIMQSTRIKHLEKLGTDKPTPSQVTDAMTSGIQNAFTLGLVFAIICLIITFFIKPVKPPVEE